MRRFPAKQSPELRAAIELQNTANRIAKVESRKPTWQKRAEANAVRRELKHVAQMTKKQRSRYERLRQAKLAADRAAIELRKRVGEILKGLPEGERKTETGIVLPSAVDIGKVLSRAGEQKGR